MANKQTNSNEYIAQAVAKAARVAIQTMSADCTARAETVLHRMSGPIISSINIFTEAQDKYNELRIFQTRGK